jgi:hypothetical protein
LAKRFASDLLVTQPIKFELVLNLKTDKALGLTFLVNADRLRRNEQLCHYPTETYGRNRIRGSLARNSMFRRSET